jgi:hypothetical protein
MWTKRKIKSILTYEKISSHQSQLEKDHAIDAYSSI